MINLKHFESNMLKIDEKHYKGVDIYYIGYITIKKIHDCENPLYLMVGEAEGFIEEKNGSNYLVFHSTVENKEVLKKYTKLWDGIKNEIETRNGGKKG